MRHQPITDESWTEAEALSLMRSLGASGKRAVKAVCEPVADPMIERRAVLARTFADEVIPRLLQARRGADKAPSLGADPSLALELATLALRASQAEAAAYVERLRTRGHSTESLLLDLLAPAARHLGQMWEDDICDFSDVTVGLLRLGNVLRLLGRAFASEGAQAHAAGPHILLVQAPGEQHGLGLAMVVQFFQRAGWRVQQAPCVTSAGLVALVQNNDFALVGISVSCSGRLDDLAADIGAVRRYSRNPGLGVMVGGPPFISHPGLAQLVGADATACDARQAVIQAQALLGLSASAPELTGFHRA